MAEYLRYYETCSTNLMVLITLVKYPTMPCILINLWQA